MNKTTGKMGQLKNFYRFIIKPHIIYFGILGVLDVCSHYKSPMINSRKQLEYLLPEERKSAGIDDKVIIDINIDTSIPCVNKISDDHYKLSFKLNSPTSSDLSTLKHELFHIADKTPSPIRLIRYLYWNEPRAIYYSATGLKP